MLWHGAAAPCQLAERPGTSIKLKAVVSLALPVACNARGGGSETTALVAKITRQPRGTWQGRSSASATDQKTQTVDQAKVTMRLAATKVRLAGGGMVTLVATGGPARCVSEP